MAGGESPSAPYSQKFAVDSQTASVHTHRAPQAAITHKEWFVRTCKAPSFAAVSSRSFSNSLSYVGSNSFSLANDGTTLTQSWTLRAFCSLVISAASQRRIQLNSLTCRMCPASYAG